MRAVTRVLVIVLACVLRPASASAISFIDWLEKLSGPGPMMGLTLEADLVCDVWDRDLRTTAGVSASLAPQGANRTMHKVTPSHPWTRECWAREVSPDDRRTTLSAEFSFLNTGKANLPYDPPIVEGKRTAVHAFRAIVAVDVRLHRALDIGAGVGVIRFWGDRFDPFYRSVIQPARLRVRPLLIPSARLGHFGEALTLTGTLSTIGTLRAADFGATGDFSSEGELNTGFSASVDVFRLIAGIRESK